MDGEQSVFDKTHTESGKTRLMLWKSLTDDYTDVGKYFLVKKVRKT